MLNELTSKGLSFQEYQAAPEEEEKATEAILVQEPSSRDPTEPTAVAPSSQSYEEAEKSCKRWSLCGETGMEEVDKEDTQEGQASARGSGAAKNKRRGIRKGVTHADLKHVVNSVLRRGSDGSLEAKTADEVLKAEAVQESPGKRRGPRSRVSYTDLKVVIDSNISIAWWSGSPIQASATSVADAALLSSSSDNNNVPGSKPETISTACISRRRPSLSRTSPSLMVSSGNGPPRLATMRSVSLGKQKEPVSHPLYNISDFD
jgi:hypothetical protein